MVQVDGNQTWQEELFSIGLETGAPLSSTIQIDAAQEIIWQRLNEAGHLKCCHPFCKSTEVEQWPGKGSRDKITYYSGREYYRHFVEWFDGIGYDIELGEPPRQTSRVQWRITPLSETCCRFAIAVIPYLKMEHAEEKKKQYQARLFGPDLQHYLDCVVKGVEFWIRTGQVVEKDQFGRNPLYSG